MARTTDTAGRLERLNRALERAKQLPIDTILDAKPMSDLIGFSWVTLRDWCDNIGALDGSSAFVRGGNGVKWQFHPVAMVSALITAFSADAEKAASRNRDLQRQVGVEVPESERTADLAETRQLISMTLQVQAAEQEQGGFLPAQEVKNFLDGYNQLTVESILGVKSEMDPTGTLPPETIIAIDDLLRAVALRVHERCAEYIETFNAGLRQGGTGTAR
jgi:hypothetical protein